MTQLVWRPRLAFLVASVLFSLGSCFADSGSLGVAPTGGTNATSGGTSSTGVGGEGGGSPVCEARPPKEGATCRPVESAEPLRLRLVKDEPQDSIVFVNDLFQQFKAHCGACHVDTNLGDQPFQVAQFNMTSTLDDRAIRAIRSETAECNNGADCINYMPPAGLAGAKPWSERKDDPNDPIVKLLTLMEVWVEQDRPVDYFILPADKGGKSLYPVDEDFAATMTHIGSCIPDEGMVATEAGEACDLDARFAAMARDPDSLLPEAKIGLPLKLEQTDLFTFDSAELATFGVVAYAPTYPLWTDDAGKLRHIRVPRGTSVKYDPETKQFEIPRNTRFYKTFLKEVIAADGEKRFRKIETRVIVSRGEESLFGTYYWNDGETDATLVTNPLRNGEPFTDVLRVIVTDEPKAAEVQALKDQGLVNNLTYELDQQKAVRRYAIPGSERCIQCHIGDESFVLGFSPLQVRRRPCTEETLQADGHCEGGILDPAGRDEVSQLERLISYGVITGMDPQRDVVLLEDPQGTPEAPRPHRTPEELVAQGYLLGNCAHCHNPIGYPTRENPELGALLNFLPGEAGGVFGFPLERYSPRIKRGPTGDISLPYITPSLRDIMPAGLEAGENKWKKKYKETPDPEVVDGVVLEHYEAPWRSLIYRNVDTPFTYTEHFAIYPKMPINSPGFDCRAPRILGDWMVSIPAVPKNPTLNEDLETGHPRGAETDPQPYVEVSPDDPQYAYAQTQARKRLETYRQGPRYATYCPDTSDIIDPVVALGRRLTPEDGTWRGSDGGLLLPIDSVPDRPHWAVTDLTETPGPWTPRRTGWKEIFAELPPLPATAKPEEKAAWEAEKEVLDLLKVTPITENLRAFAAEERPFGVWKDKPECATKLSGARKLGEYAGDERRRWMKIFDPLNEKTDLRVFNTTPGEAVYDMICTNCHGAKADSRGRQATTLQDMTGGTGRVANFRDGLFGPVGTGGENRERVFGDEDTAARYLAWMALGGTRTKIPAGILDLVANTQVLGEKRQQFNSATKSANMLQVAQNLCYGVAVMGTETAAFKPELVKDNEPWDLYTRTGLIASNGDAEMWQDLCSLDNPAPVRVATVIVPTSGEPYLNLNKVEFYRARAYPANARVGQELGPTQPSLTSDNHMPWCVRTPTDPAALEWLAKKKDSAGQPYALCPSEFLVPANRFEYFQPDQTSSLPPVAVELNRWAVRGAINVGFAVFLFLDGFIGDDKTRGPRYNECELLPD